jgi:hypothetical protein
MQIKEVWDKCAQEEKDKLFKIGWFSLIGILIACGALVIFYKG